MRPLATVLAFLVSLSTASAQLIVPVSQTRAVSGSALAGDELDFENDMDAASAGGFDPFDEVASASATVLGGDGAGGGSQASEIRSQQILATGSAFAMGAGYSSSGFGNGSGQSDFRITFDVVARSSYVLRGSVEAYDSGGAGVTLSSASQAIFSAGAGNQLVPFDQRGILDPGRYTLQAGTSGSAFGGFGSYGYAFGSYDLSLSLTPLPRPPHADPIAGGAGLGALPQAAPLVPPAAGSLLVSPTAPRATGS